MTDFFVLHDKPLYPHKSIMVDVSLQLQRDDSELRSLCYELKLASTHMFSLYILNCIFYHSIISKFAAL